MSGCVRYCGEHLEKWNYEYDDSVQEIIKRQSLLRLNMPCPLSHAIYQDMPTLPVLINTPITGSSRVGDETLRRIMEAIVLPLDGMVREFDPQLRECSVGM